MKTQDQPLPTKSELLKSFRSLPPEKLSQLDEFIAQEFAKEIWLPLPGPQTLAYHCKADVLFYGGAAGGAKTDLLLGLAAREHYRSAIYRREFTQVKSIEERSEELFSAYGHYNKSTHIWIFKDGRRIELGAVNNVGDEIKYQGRPRDFIGFDEVTHFTKPQFVFLTGWNRSVRRGQRKRVVAAGNPPTTIEGNWVIEYWPCWLDENYPNPAQPGELRYFITDAHGKTTEVETADPIEYKGKTIVPQSRTFIPSSLDDNLYLEGTGYETVLNSLPEPLRSQLLFGDFKAGMKDDPWQVFPTVWLRQAQARWKKRKPPLAPIDQIGVDVSRGGQDRTVITPRWKNYFGEQRVHEGVTTSDGPKVAALVIAVPQINLNVTIAAVDVIGVGSSVYDSLAANHIKVVKLNASEGTEEVDKASGRLGFINFRALWAWRLREDLDPDSGMDLAIPDDPELFAELTAMRWKLTVRGIQILGKDEIKEIIGRSPDKGESLIYAHANPPMVNKGIFEYYEKMSQGKAEKEAAGMDGRKTVNPPIVLGTEFRVPPRR
jgi:hypothetical protein